MSRKLVIMSLREVTNMAQIYMLVDQQYSGFNPIVFGYEYHVPLHQYGPTILDYWLVHYVVSGFGTFEYEGETYRVGPGDFFVIPPHVKTFHQADPQNPWAYIWVGFTTDINLPGQLHKRVVNYPEAASIFEDMKNCLTMENGGSAFLSGCLWKFIGILLDEHKPKYNFVDKAISYMKAEYMNSITIQEIADHLNLDRKYFSGAFSKHVGSSPQQYLLNLRLTKAAEFMTAHNQSPSSAAALVGYTDLYQFSKIFKKHFGMSPRTYAKHYLEMQKQQNEYHD